MRTLLSCTLAMMLLAGVAAYGHHSYAATYDTSKEVKVTGKLIQFSYKNPIRTSPSRPRTTRALCNGGRWNGQARHSSATVASIRTR
jgi:hypothetical protein